MGSMYRGRKIIDTKHSIDRYLDRYPNLSKNTIIAVVTKAIDKILDTYNDEETTYGIWSKSTGICIIIDWRKENYNSDGMNHAVLVSLPPKKNSFNDFHTTKPNDIRIMVEKRIQENISLDRIKESSISDYIIEVDSGANKVFIEEGSIYDYGIGIYFSV